MHHSRSKHIDIKHHFIRDHVLKSDSEVSFISTDFHLANIFTKLLLDEGFVLFVNLWLLLRIHKLLILVPALIIFLRSNFSCVLVNIFVISSFGFLRWCVWVSVDYLLWLIFVKIHVISFLLMQKGENYCLNGSKCFLSCLISLSLY